jgi:hypothetical protein
MSWPARPIKLGSSIAVVGLYAGLLSLIIRNNKERSVSWPSCSYDANNDDDAWFFAWETAGYLERCGESGQQTCRTTSDFGLELIFRAPNRLRSDLLCIGAWQSFPMRSNRFKRGFGGIFLHNSSAYHRGSFFFFNHYFYLYHLPSFGSQDR